MVVQPTSELRILSGINIGKDYTNTLYFISENEQGTFFDSKAKYRLNEFSYIRNSGVVRVGLSTLQLLGCNYIMYRNVLFQNKWFYAFIDSIEYLNNSTTEIRFTIDEIQTWFFDMTLKESYVERETNGGPETLETVGYGNIVCNKTVKTGFFNDYSILISASESMESLYPPGMLCGLYTGAYYRAYPMNPAGATLAQQVIQSFANDDNVEGILSVVAIPSQFYSSDGEVVTKEFSIAKPTTIGNYTPRHSKLLRYPYSYLLISTGSAQQEYRFEYFKTSNSCDFKIYGTTAGNPQVMLVPEAYNSSYFFNYDKKMIIDGFPQLTYNTSSYRQWLAEKTAAQWSIASSVGKASVGSFMGGGSILAGAASGMEGVSMETLLKATESVNDMGSSAVGSNSGDIEVATKSKDFYFNVMQITEEYARMLDDYFDRYGEFCGRIKVPSIGAGSYHYIKTAECNISGKLPNESLETIKNAFNKGITFWKSNENVGNY